MAKSIRQHRHKARILAMQALFQYDTRGTERPTLEQLLTFNWMDYAVPEEEQEFARAIIRQTVEHIDEIDTQITERLVGWEFSRLSPVNRAILRTGVAQLKYMAQDADAPVVIDECIQLSRKYDDVQSAAFVNGILDSVQRGAAPGTGTPAKIPVLKEKIRLKKPVAKKSNPK
ncbi:MAG TPA: transcription antitermination factor NusB [Turneriella sp.]|nr:transcription antitermination factor NusB [Turneriella sp.]